MFDINNIHLQEQRFINKFTKPPENIQPSINTINSNMYDLYTYTCILYV